MILYNKYVTIVLIRKGFQMYRVIFSCGSEILEVWEFNDVRLTSHRMKMIWNNLQCWQYMLCEDQDKYIAFAIEDESRTIMTGTEFLSDGVVYRTLWETRRRYNVVYRKVYFLGGVK